MSRDRNIHISIGCGSLAIAYWLQRLPTLKNHHMIVCIDGDRFLPGQYGLPVADGERKAEWLARLIRNYGFESVGIPVYASKEDIIDIVGELSPYAYRVYVHVMADDYVDMPYVNYFHALNVGTSEDIEFIGGKLLDRVLIVDWWNDVHEYRRDKSGGWVTAGNGYGTFNPGVDQLIGIFHNIRSRNLYNQGRIIVILQGESPNDYLYIPVRRG